MSPPTQAHTQKEMKEREHPYVGVKIEILQENNKLLKSLKLKNLSIKLSSYGGEEVFGILMGKVACLVMGLV